MSDKLKELKLRAGINDNPDQEGLDLFAQLIIQELENRWNTVIVDDRNVWFWVKVKDADLLWIPRRIIVSEKSIASWWFEYKHRKSNDVEIVTLDQIEKIIYKK